MIKRFSILMSMFLILGMFSFNYMDSAIAEDGFEVVHEESYRVSPGVNHTSLRLQEKDSTNLIQLMEIDPKNPFVNLVSYSSKAEAYGLETVGNMINEKRDLGEQVVGGVNGDFFSSVGVPSGLQIIDGEITTSPSSIKALMLMFPDKTIKLEDSVRMTAIVTAENGETLELNMFNRSRVASHSNHAFLFNFRFGESAKTPVGGIEVVVDVGEDNDQIIAGKSIEGIVETIEETADTLLERGKFVLSATGEKANWIRKQLANGSKIQVNITFSKDVNKAKFALSGNSTLGTVLLKEGEIWKDLLDLTNPNNTEKHPRTMLATKQGKLYVLSVDGRQEGHSDGMTLPGAARYLQSLGMEAAINIDGGGSTTYYVRQPGELQPKLLNSPSDGHERPVGNSLLIISKAPQQSELEGISLYPLSSLNIVAGSKIRLTPKGYDKFMNPVSIEPKDLYWSTQDGIGTINQSGLFSAGESIKEGQITVQYGEIKTEKRVSVTNQVARLELSPSSFVIESGKAVSFRAKAYDEFGNLLVISPDVLSWSTEGEIGSITDDGVLRTKNKRASGKVIAHYGDLAAEASVEVGPSPIIEDFEYDSRIRSAEVRTVPDSVNLSLESDPEFVRFGQHAARLSYDFTGTAGTSGAYVEFLDKNAQVGRQIKGKPTRIGVWVYGDAKFHRLRLGVTDSTGKNLLWNMTTIGGINWTGWRYVYASVPEDSAFPITVRNIAIEEANQHNKNAGVLYYDNLHAVYTDPDQEPNIQLLVEDFIRSGEIKGPLAKQLNNKLKQAQHHLNKGSMKQTEKFINDFLTSVNDPSNQNLITPEAKDELNRSINLSPFIRK